MKFSGMIQNIILHLSTNFQPRLFSQPNHILAFLTFKMAFKMAFFQVLFLVRLSDNLFQIGFVHTFAGVRLLKSPFYYYGSIANARLEMTQNDDLGITPKIFEIMR